MAAGSGRHSAEPPLYGPNGAPDPIKSLYPMVNEEETPLPRCWSSKDKYSFIGLSQNNLRVHYKGHGKNHKDAASVRATHPIPAACGLYYYEVKIVSKGRDGYMGIGLSSQGVNMNRLPGWDKNSFGYHGDDGHSFCSSGSGHPYGPTFTTGDVIGCGINLIDNVCFYTKNGHYLGVAFTDLPVSSQLYPTVGLQTPGEVVDANFGQAPFVFDIGEMMRELQCRVRTTIQNFPVPDTHGQWQTMLHRMVSTYLVHHGYCATAEGFARSTGQDFDEELTSIRNRQKIQKLVLSGRMGEAIETVQQLYPGLLENNHNLLFMLKVRQFIEMVNGTDTDVRGGSRSPSRPPTHEATPSPTPPCWANGRPADPPPPTDIENGSTNGSGSGRKMCGGNPAAIERMLTFGREVQHMSQILRHQLGKSDHNKKMLQDAFSLLAYNDPWNSPVGWQLDPIQREPVCQSLNSAILESHELPRRPPLEICVAHTRQLLTLMSRSGLGSCAFSSVDAVLGGGSGGSSSPQAQTQTHQPSSHHSLAAANSAAAPATTTTTTTHLTQSSVSAVSAAAAAANSHSDP
ncbi:ran-binding protein 9-like isoform X4 [Eriocheir sinensis]|uniref:ran-binding protein 9-like isoform X4 n=1 Tax=Eriocheir sinensis TaxID=95602 RepID=UPI0021C8E7FF|nr:ran-binding protein 9-like isoform X4 [Eriocheir sinensis]